MKTPEGGYIGDYKGGDYYGGLYGVDPSYPP